VTLAGSACIPPPLVPASTTPCSHAGFCSGDPALGGDCGADIAEPSLACNGSWTACVPAAAAACAANPQCNAFGMSSVWPAAAPLKVP